MARHLEEFQNRGYEVVAIAQASPTVLTQYLLKTPLMFPIVSDPDRTAYQAFGLERTSWFTFFRPRVIWGYLRLMFQGTRLQTPYAGEDVRQLGGDFVLNRTGELLFTFRSPDPTARPSIAELLAVSGD